MDDGTIIKLFFARDQQAIREVELKYGKLCRDLSYNLREGRPAMLRPGEKTRGSGRPRPAGGPQFQRAALPGPCLRPTSRGRPLALFWDCISPGNPVQWGHK